MQLEPSTSSGSIAVTTGVQQVVGQGILTYASVVGGTTGNALTIYDGLSTSGLLLAEVKNATAVSQDANIPAVGVRYNVGLFVVVSGTGSTAVLHYQPT